MEKGKRYLVKQGKSKSILEWECLEVAEIGYKVKTLIKERYVFAFSTTSDEAFWILKTEIDKIGQTEYQILEDLKD